MKIVFLAPFGIRPKGTLKARMIPLAIELQRIGHIVTIIAPPYTNPEDSGTNENVEGVLIRNITLSSLKSFLSAPLLSWRMFRMALAETPDLIHLFKPKGYAGLAAILILLLSRLKIKLPPLFVDSDDWEGSGGMNDLMLYGKMEKLLFQLQDNWIPPKASGVTVASRTLQSRMWGVGIKPQDLLYLPNGVREHVVKDSVSVRKELNIDQSAPVVILYTRFFEFSQKKLYFVFSEIHRQLPEVLFLVVGKGRKGEETFLENAGKKCGFSSSLIIAGWVEPDVLPSYLASADVAIYPFEDNLINRSKCSAKLTELIISGVPVVADRVGQLAEYIVHGKTGILCSPDNWQEMADATVMLIKNREKRREFSQEGIKHILSEFSWQTLADRLNSFYQEHVTK